MNYILTALLSCSPLAAQTPGGATPLPGPFQDPGPHDLDPVRFAVLGNYGSTSAASFAVAALLHELAPEFVLTLGGNNFPDGGAETLDANVGQHYHDFIHPYSGSYGPGASVNRFFPCLGSEDWATTEALPYLNYFELPHNERYYTFRRGPVQFFALDSVAAERDGIDRDSVQASWLEDRLRASNARFKVVYLQGSPYSSGESHGSQGILQWPFKEWGASIVLSGQDHVYERLEVSGLPYVVIGLGGQATEPFGPRLGGSALQFRGEDGVLMVDASDSFARFRFLTTGGSVQDYFILPRDGIDPGVSELIREDDQWKYLDTGTDPGPTWTRLAFNDSAWPIGQAQFGYGDGDEQTVVHYGADPNNRFVTTWFRRPFYLTHAGELEALQLRLLHDDGAVVHLNGTEVARVGMPAGAISSNTLASSSASGNKETTFYPFIFGGFRQGWNVIAVEIHQASVVSSDLSFAAQLVGLHGGDVLLPLGSTWRFLDTGVVPHGSWKDPGFDDSQWQAGPAQLGFGENDEATKTSQGHNTTTYFRTTFSVAQASSVHWLSCRLLRDDGALVYLNGHSAARFNLPNTTVRDSTFASFNVSEDQEVFTSTTLDPRDLVEGVNTIAVAIHQSSSTSDDLSFDLELVAY